MDELSKYICLCGCGGQIEIKKWHKYYGIPQYIKGHGKGSYKHGETKGKLYGIWKNMKDRCFRLKNKFYKYYGGRGITVCPEWTNKVDGYVNFRDWALSNGYKEGLIFDRENPDGNYEPSNCRFLSILESNRNKTTTITMEIANEIRELYKTGDYTQQELAEKFNISRSSISLIVNNKQW